MSPLLLRRLSDESLGRRLAAGEAAAFDEIYLRYVNRLAAYGAHLLGDAAAGDDVAQSTLLKAYGALRDGRVPDHLKAWLYRVAHNTAVDVLARRRELPSEGLPERAAPANDPTSGALVAALASLPERQRHVYVLRELHGLRIDETAAELHLTAAQVEQALFAARNRLAEHLVFGDRLDCVAVHRLAAGPLDRDERRALRTHLRSCSGCRRAVGSATRPFGLVPADALGWLRALPGLLAGGGAPAAAKIGAVVAAATLAGGAPIAYEINKDRNPRHVAAHVKAPVRARRAAGRPALARHVTLPPAQPLAAVVPIRTPVAAQPAHSSGDGGGGEQRHGARRTAAPQEQHRERDGRPTGEREPGDRHRAGSASATAAPTPDAFTAPSGADGAGASPPGDAASSEGPGPSPTTTTSASDATVTVPSGSDGGATAGTSTSGDPGRLDGSGSGSSDGGSGSLDGGSGSSDGGSDSLDH